MKRLLLPFALLLVVPFNTSCIKEITFDVDVSGEHCNWDEPTKKATMSHDYNIKIVPDSGYELFLAMDTPGSGIYIANEKLGPISPQMSYECYDEKTSILTIPSTFVNSKITIIAIAEKIENHE